VGSITSLADYRKSTVDGWNDHLSKARAATAETSSNNRRHRPARSVPLTAEQLLAIWQHAAKAGAPGAAARIAALSGRSKEERLQRA
jgi:hypothetical protein